MQFVNYAKVSEMYITLLCEMYISSFLSSSRLLEEVILVPEQIKKYSGLAPCCAGSVVKVQFQMYCATKMTTSEL